MRLTMGHFFLKKTYICTWPFLFKMLLLRKENLRQPEKTQSPCIYLNEIEKIGFEVKKGGLMPEAKKASSPYIHLHVGLICKWGEYFFSFLSLSPLGAPRTLSLHLQLL